MKLNIINAEDPSQMCPLKFASSFWFECWFYSKHEFAFLHFSLIKKSMNREWVVFSALTLARHTYHLGPRFYLISELLTTDLTPECESPRVLWSRYTGIRPLLTQTFTLGQLFILTLSSQIQNSDEILRQNTHLLFRFCNVTWAFRRWQNEMTSLNVNIILSSWYQE